MNLLRFQRPMDRGAALCLHSHKAATPAPRPSRALRRGPVACRRPTGLARRGRGAAPARPGKACARRAAWGVRADPRRGHQRAQGGRGWADAVGWDGVKWLYFFYTPTVWPVRRAFTHAVARGMIV